MISDRKAAFPNTHSAHSAPHDHDTYILTIKKRSQHPHPHSKPVSILQFVVWDGVDVFLELTRGSKSDVGATVVSVLRRPNAQTTARFRNGTGPVGWLVLECPGRSGTSGSPPQWASRWASSPAVRSQLRGGLKWWCGSEKRRVETRATFKSTISLFVSRKAYCEIDRQR